MAYSKQTWKNLPDQTTPLSADRLNHLETQYDESKEYTDSKVSSATQSLVSTVNNKSGPNVTLQASDVNSPTVSEMYSAIDDAVSGGTGGGTFSDPRLIASLTSDRCVIAFVGSSTTSIGEYPAFLTGRMQVEGGHGRYVKWDDLSGQFTGAGVIGVNAGASGKGVEEYLGGGRRSVISNLNPSIVIHSIGAGDWKTGKDPEWFKGQLDQQVDSITSNVPILNILVHQHERTDVTSEYTWDEFRAATREVASMGDNRIFVDASEDMRSAGVGVGLDNRYNLLSTDNVHLTEHGHQVLASIIAKKLNIFSGVVTGWVDLSQYLASSYSSGYIRARKVGSVIEMYVASGASSTIPTGNTVIATLPKEWCPPWGLIRGGTYFSSGYTGVGYLSDTGSIGISQQTGGSRTNALTTFVFPVGGADERG